LDGNISTTLNDYFSGTKKNTKQKQEQNNLTICMSNRIKE